VQNAIADILDIGESTKTTEAMDWFKRAIGSNPDYVVTYINLGFLQQNHGKNDTAMANYQKKRRILNRMVLPTISQPR
jgi:hypothetical protein